MPTALLIVDVQNDFTEGGALGVVGGAEIADGITRVLHQRSHDYAVVIASRDYHDGESDNGGHFATTAPPDFRTTWPRHCVAGTPGAEYHPALDTEPIDVEVRKGWGEPAYSAYEGATIDGRSLRQVLAEHSIDTLEVVGIATDFCVLATVQDALNDGCGVHVHQSLIAGVAAASTAEALQLMADAGAVIS